MFLKAVFKSGLRNREIRVLIISDEISETNRSA